jgi:hypothetical protein
MALGRRSTRYHQRKVAAPFLATPSPTAMVHCGHARFAGQAQRSPLRLCRVSSRCVHRPAPQAIQNGVGHRERRPALPGFDRQGVGRQRGTPLPSSACQMDPTTIARSLAAGISDFKMALTRGTRALLVHRSGSAAPQLCVGQDARSLRQDHQPRLVHALSRVLLPGLVKRLAHAPSPLLNDRPQDRQLQSVASSDQHHLPGLSVA